MAFCGTASWWAKLAFLFLFAASIMHIVGWATPSWMIQESGGTTYRVGLWRTRTCSGGACSETSVGSSYKTDKFRATQAMETIAFILFLIAPFLLGLYVFTLKFRDRTLVIICMILCFVIAFFLVLGIIIWMTYVVSPWSVSYSFGFTVIACILVVTAGLFLIPEVDNNRIYWLNIFRGGSSRDSSPSERSFRSRSTSRSRSVSPYPSSRRTLRSDSNRLSASSIKPEYDRMPSPAVTEAPRNMLTANGGPFRPATYNDISNLRLQRDAVGFVY